MKSIISKSGHVADHFAHYSSSHSSNHYTKWPFNQNVLLVWALLMTICSLYYGILSYQCPYKWHGGSPDFNKGSCWCGGDGYCMCTPNFATGVIMEIVQNNEIKIIIVKRRDPPVGFAIPGGFVNLGEMAEDSAIREMKEELNLNLDINKIEQFHLYSDPQYDKRRHSASLIFRYVFEKETDIIGLKSGDDAKELILINLNDILKLDLMFDHHIILKQYIAKYHPQYKISSSKL